MKRSLLALLLGLVLLLGACGNQAQSGSVKKGDEILSTFAAKDLNGNVADQNLLKGKKLTVVNVWATFCGPCLREMPALQTLSEEMASQGVQVIGIVADVTDLNYREQSDKVALARSLVAQTGVKYTCLIPNRDLTKVCDVQGFPTTYFVDENGCQVGETLVGARSLEAWRSLVTDALEAVS